MNITPIDHPHRPLTAYSERCMLQTQLDKLGPDAVISGLMASSVTFPEQGSFAGWLWVIAEWIKGYTTDEPTPAMINAAAKEIWDDLHARMGGRWEDRDANEVIVVQLKATAKAALQAALKARL